MKKCPKCKSSSKVRMRRKGVLRLINGSRAYSCDDCNTYYAWFPIVNSTIRV